MKVLKGTVSSASFDDATHRVKVTVPDICKDVLCQTLNGLYLRSGEEVYVYFKEDYLDPLVLGRVDGQVELSSIVEVINDMVDKYNKHVHPLGSIVTALITFATAVSAITPSQYVVALTSIKDAATALVAALPSATQTDKTLKKMDKISEDDLLY